MGLYQECPIDSPEVKFGPKQQILDPSKTESLQTTIFNTMKIAKSPLKGQKTLWEKEKLLVTRNFSFSHSVSKDS